MTRRHVISVLETLNVSLGAKERSSVIGEHAWILMGLVVFAVRVFFVPVQDPAHEGRDEGDVSLGARDGLSEREQQSHVAVDPVFLLQLPEQKTNTQHVLITAAYEGVRCNTWAVFSKHLQAKSSSFWRSSQLLVC